MRLALIGAALFITVMLIFLAPSRPIEYSGTVLTLQGPKDIYPPAGITGATNPSITQATISKTICNKNWSTKSIRPPSTYTTKLKIQQLQTYGYSDKNPVDFEEDHFISLELGGNPTAPTNLWPEGYNIADAPTGGAREKDKVENALHALVCSGQLSLAQAQHLITTDWYAEYVKLGLQ